MSGSALSGSAAATVRAGQTAQVSITLNPTSHIANTFIVHFRFNSAFVEPCMRQTLQRAARYAQNHGDEKLVIVGHTDKVDTRDYNQSLSERRARSVFSYLTFGTDTTLQAAAMAEWEALRETRQQRNQPTIRDNWDVREYQQILQVLDFYPGPIDGDRGPLTRDAIQAYRCQRGFPPGDDVDADVWRSLIQEYLAGPPNRLSVPKNQFFPNCTNEILKWLGCGEDDPLDRRGTAFRPSRRVELMFVRTDRLPCQIPEPDTFNLPTPGAVNSSWCVGGTSGSRCCFVSPALQRGTNNPQPCPTSPQGAWCRQPAEPGTITVTGSLRREVRQPGGTVRLDPVPNREFVLISPNGQFKQDEQPRGEPNPARTDSNGAFSFSNLPVGVYTLEVIARRRQDYVLVRLDTGSYDDALGAVVCKRLTPSDTHFNVVIVEAPVLREIRLPVAVHLMTALHPLTREVRTCADPINPTNRVPQATNHTEADVRSFFVGANTIWRQARVRFELTDTNIVREAYAFRTECEVDSQEFAFILERCAYPNAVNIFFFGDLAGMAEAGLYVKTLIGGGPRTVDGCAVSDRFQFAVFTPAPNVQLTAEQTIQVLAHELGHYLGLGIPDHVENTPANAGRLMLPGTNFSGDNRTLVQTEVDSARASDNAALECITLSLRVTGATQVGGTLSNHYIFVQDPDLIDPFDITVDADIPDYLLANGTLTMTDGTTTVTGRQMTVSKANTAETTVVATYSPTGGGQPVSCHVVVRVATFTLRVNGANVSPTESNVFVSFSHPTDTVTIIADINPAPFCVPTSLVTWSAGDEVPDPLRRTLPKASGGQTTITATIAGESRTVVIRILDLAFVANRPPFDDVLTEVHWDDAFRIRADIPGETRDELTVLLNSIRRP